MKKVVGRNELWLNSKRTCTKCQGTYVLKKVIETADRLGDKKVKCPNCQAVVGNF